MAARVPVSYGRPARHSADHHPAQEFTLIEITSFGYLHADAPAADITLDLRRHFRDPHINPELRHLTAHDQAVQDAVLATPGIQVLIGSVLTLAQAYLQGPAGGQHPLRIAVGCAGGRHRAAVVAATLCRYFTAMEMPATLTHRDLDKPVVNR